jgi:penicillin-binding protein 1B
MAAELSLVRPRLRDRKRTVVIHRETERLGLLTKIRPYLEVAVFLLLVSLTVASGFVISAYRDFAVIVDEQIAGGYLKSHAGLYAAPRVIEKGARLTRDQFAATLQSGGYARDKASSIWNGSFTVNDAEIRIHPRQGADVHEWVEVKFDNSGHVAALSANDRDELPSYALEPELLTTDASLKIGKQQSLTFEEIPPVLVQAIIAIEDRRFFEHSGVDIRGIGRALLSFSSRGRIHFQQGGSTITQQLVKNVYLTPEKTLQRKFNEAILALVLENRLSKQDIFSLYCNEIYLGQRNGVGVRGVAQAARVYFGKDLQQLSLQEAATIAGMIQGPSRYAPDKHADAAKDRRDLVINAMIREGVIGSDQALTAEALPVAVAAFDSTGNEMAPYYVDSVNRALEATGSASEDAEAQGLRVQTTIDPDLQAAAEQALVHQLDALGKSSRGPRPQGAMVALDPQTGQVLAMVGGRNYAESQLNRATDAKRQPGSVFKPFVYAAALEAGYSPLSTFSDTPQTFEYGNATYSPGNYRKSYAMHDVMMREGLVRSLNVVTVDLAMRVGLTRVANTAARFGLPRPAAYPSLALGTTEVTPLQVAAAYAAFVNGGKRVAPTLVTGIINSGERPPYDVAPAAEQIVSPATAYMITDMLSDVTSRGTAGRAKANFKNLAIAGKTGTSRDGWFVGYTPNLVCAVWIGYDDNKQLGLTGAEAALPAWMDFVKEAVAIRPSLGGTQFAKPAGIMTVRVDPETGFMAGPNCPSSVVVNVASRFAPVTDCYKHRPLESLLTEDVPTEVAYEEPVFEHEVVPEAHQSSRVDEDALTDPGEPLESSPAVATPKRTRQTLKQIDQRSRPILVNDPVLAQKP